MPDGFCLKPERTSDPDNQEKVYMLTGSGPSGGGGTWFCQRCGSKGSWYDLKRLSSGFEITKGVLGPEITKGVRGIEGQSEDRARKSGGRVSLRLPDQKVAKLFPVNLLGNPFGDKEVYEIMEYLTGTGVGQRGLNLSTLINYCVGVGEYKFLKGSQYVKRKCVTFPWVMSSQQLATQDEALGQETDGLDEGQEAITRRIKARSWQEKGYQRLDPPGGGWGLFGFHLVGALETSIVLTEGEYDAMAVYQDTEIPAVSLPNGASSLPPEVLPLLERFEKIYLFLDNDAPGQVGAEKFAKKLGVGRCLLVRPLRADLDLHPAGALKDANDALRLGVRMKPWIEAAEPLQHRSIATFKSLREQVLHEISNPGEFNGTKLLKMPLFTEAIKGLRKGELSVVTGPTGSGKTTLLSQLSLDLAEQNVSTLWGSFEVKNTRLMKKMLHQFNGQPLVQPGTSEVIEGLRDLADRFEALPLYFMTFHGGSDVDQVLDAMEHAVYVHDVENVIIDNLQFMMTMRKGFDKFEAQDSAIEKFRKFATENNVHVTLVVHPRKEVEGARLGISSIFGSAKVTQEADLVVILQYDGEVKYIDVKKNRYDGELGIIPMSFSPITASFYEDAGLLPVVKQRINAAASRNGGFSR